MNRETRTFLIGIIQLAIAVYLIDNLLEYYEQEKWVHFTILALGWLQIACKGANRVSSTID